uniref:Uncharacterized protein n=1 Tax=Tanacetum cinerariifolium TaxID=118510 RepID=A0A699I327_TANCI|nr:hypothetical protein [Tanacetum cinerariifolium]
MSVNQSTVTGTSDEGCDCRPGGVDPLYCKYIKHHKDIDHGLESVTEMTIDIIILNDAKIIDHGITTVIFLNCFSVYLAYENEVSVSDVFALSRTGWMQITGVPLNFATSSNTMSIASRWGNVLHIPDKELPGHYEDSLICLMEFHTPLMINEVAEVMLNDTKRMLVSVREVDFGAPLQHKSRCDEKLFETQQQRNHHVQNIFSSPCEPITYKLQRSSEGI